MAFEIETRLLRYVIAVAGEGNISRAAKKRVYVAAPSLAREIRELETRLGYKLFNRHWRGVSLTPAGEAFIEEARKARSHILRAIERGAAASRGEAGRLVLGHSPCLQTKQLIQVERRFAEAAPSAKIEFRSAFGEPLLEWVLSEIVDAALVVLPIESDEIHSECIWKQPLVVALPEDWSLASMPIVSLAGLSEMPSIWPAKSLYPTGEAGILNGTIDQGKLSFTTKHVPDFSDEEATITVEGRVSGDEIEIFTQDKDGYSKGRAHRVSRVSTPKVLAPK